MKLSCKNTYLFQKNKESNIESRYSIITYHVRAKTNIEEPEDRTYPYRSEIQAAIPADSDTNSMTYKLYQLICSDKAKKIIEESGYVPR